MATKAPSRVHLGQAQQACFSLQILVDKLFFFHSKKLTNQCYHFHFILIEMA